MKYWFYIIVILFTACVPKEEPDNEVVGDPVFYVKGTVNGQSITLKAGEQKYYMHTGVLSDTGDLVRFSGVLSQDDCATCGVAFQLLVRNYTNAAVYAIDSAIKQGMYVFYDGLNPVKKYYQADLVAQAFNDTNAIHQWTNGNGDVLSGSYVTTRYNQPGVYAVSLQTSYAGGCQASNSLQVSVPSGAKENYEDFKFNHLDSNAVLFNSIPVNNNASVSWDFGDGNVGSGTIAQHHYANPGIYRVCMYYQSQDSVTISHCKNVPTRTAGGCVTNMRYRVREFTDRYQFSGITIKWKDSSGKWYSSDAVAQPSSAYFEILSVEPYEFNSDRLPTQKIKIRASCRVSDGTTILNLEQIEAVVAVAYQM